MRDRRVILGIVASVVAVVAVWLFVVRRSNSSDGGGAMASRSLTAGSVEVTITPVKIDGSGAAFRVSLDTHMGELSVDLARQAHLDVGGTPWTGAIWNGDSAGGHHRIGQLTFAAGGPVEGTAELTIDGLPAPVTASWNLAG